MTLNCLVVDDEPLARKQLEGYIKQISFLKLVGTTRNPLMAAEVLKSEIVDLIFLDIKMPQQTGIEFLKTNTIFQQVIMVTAFPEFALTGFELEVTDYLMKPVSFERFLRACEKALAKVSGTDTIRSITDQADFLYLKCDQRFEKVLIKDIYYIESMLNYVRFVTSNGTFIVYSSLKAIAENLPKSHFLKIHKSYIVGIAHILAIENHQVRLNELVLPVSRSNKQVVLELAQKFKHIG